MLAAARATESVNAYSLVAPSIRRPRSPGRASCAATNAGRPWIRRAPPDDRGAARRVLKVTHVSWRSLTAQRARDQFSAWRVLPRGSRRSGPCSNPRSARSPRDRATSGSRPMWTPDAQDRSTTSRQCGSRSARCAASGSERSQLIVAAGQRRIAALSPGHLAACTAWRQPAPVRVA